MASRIHRLELPTPFPVGPVNVYLIEGREPILIDAGPNTPEAWDSLLRGFQALGATIDQIRHIIITHGHADHYGLASHIAEESGASVWIHQDDRAMIQDYPQALHDEIRGHSERRKAHLLDLFRQRELTIMQAKEGLFPDLPEGQTLLALFDVIGHLDLLRREGAVRVERRGGLLYARAA